MKYDNIFLKNLFDEGQSILKEQESLNTRQKSVNQEKKDYIKDYFNKHGIEDTRNLPLSHNTFISYPDFFLTQNEQGKICWIARGSRTTIKDGNITFGNAREELWQGQWEALPEGIKKLTVEQAAANSTSVFKMSPAIFGGNDFAAPAYILHEDSNGFQLVWRKSGSAYLGRFSGSEASNSGLQILYVGNKADTKGAWNKIKKSYETVTGKTTQYLDKYANLTQGGRLSIGFLEKEANNIDLIFGDGTTQGIIEKLKLQQANKTTKKKELKGIEHKDAKWDETEPLKHPNVQPGKLKL
jgi:hypothetical protein